MGLFDIFRRPPTEQPAHYVDLVRRQGRLEAEVETLRLQWEGYRDELKRLVTRLEKRDQRAAQKADLRAEPEDQLEIEPAADRVSERVRERRRGISKLVSG